MIFLSQLITDEDLSAIINQYNVGIELIDFSVGMNLDHLPYMLDSWHRRLVLLGNPPLTLHGPFLDLNPASYDSLAMEAAKMRFSQAYTAAVKLGAVKIIYHTCRIPTVCFVEGWAPRMADFWNRFLDKHNELPVAVENVFDEAPDPIADFASRVQSDKFSLCLDIGHAHYASDISITTWIDTLAPWISHLHLHDNFSDYDAHLPLGHGNVDWITILSSTQKLPILDGITFENTSKSDFIESLEFYNDCKNSLSDPEIKSASIT